MHNLGVIVYGFVNAALCVAHWVVGGECNIIGLYMKRSGLFIVYFQFKYSVFCKTNSSY